MKKTIAIAVLAIFTLPALKAQDPAFELDDIVANLGIGIGTSFYSGLYYSPGIPPVSISLEKGIVDNVLENGVIGVGGYLGYNSYRYRYDFLGADWGWNYSNIIVGATGSFHYPLVDQLDTYAGILLGYRILTSREFGDIPGTETNTASGGIAYSGFVGARYYFNEKFAAFVQLGYGIAYLTFGVSVKL
jgi:hypothetical protein